MAMIICMGERQYFPEDAFIRDSYGNWIHNVKPEHYASDGSPVGSHLHPVPETLAEKESFAFPSICFENDSEE